MANLSWKTLSLMAATLLVALGLQAGALKIMITLSRQADVPAPVETHAAPSKPRPSASASDPSRQPTPMPEERISAHPAPGGREPNPEAGLSDPPPANPPVKPEPSHGAPNPEAGLSIPPAPAPATAPNPPPVTPSVEAYSPPPAAKPAPVATAAPAPPVTPSPEATSASATTPAPAATGGLQEVAWMKARDPRHYTVQVYSGKDMNALREISVAVATTDPQAYFTITSRSGPWHSLMIGDYSDSATAQAAAAKMTARAPMIKPWVRRFDEVQAKLR